VSYRGSGGDTYFAVEGNLTALLYGADAAVGSLHRSEVGPALDMLYEVAGQTAGKPIPPMRHMWFSRFDASGTKVLPPEAPARDVLAALHEYVAPRAGAHCTVWDVRSNGHTVAFGNRSSKFTRVYESGAAHPDLWVPPNTLRTEVEHRTTQKGRTFMDEHDRIADIAEEDLREIGEHLTMAVAQYNIAALGLIRKGMEVLEATGGKTYKPGQDIVYAWALSVLTQGGVAALTRQGINERTAFRYKAECERLVVAAYGRTPQTVLQQAIQGATDLLARDVATRAEEAGL
jgi:hypothetical protein